MGGIIRVGLKDLVRQKKMISKALEVYAENQGIAELGDERRREFWGNVEGIGTLLDEVASALAGDGNVMLVRGDDENGSR